MRRARWVSIIWALIATAAVVEAPAAMAAIPSGPTARDAYDVWTIGDSYASGEGAPDVDGVYTDSGDVVEGQFEDWDVRFGGSPAVAGLNQDSTRCHRSGRTSTSAVATARLQEEFPDVNVAWVSVACGGASIIQTGKFNADVPPNKGGVLRGYDGAENMGKRGISADSLVPRVYPPQLTQINDSFSGRLDALIMNVGGNDAGFAELITYCLNIVPTGDCHDNADLGTFATTKLGALNDRFDRLALALRGTPRANSGDPGLRFAPRDVFITKAPNPLRPTATTFCDRTPAGNYEENLKAVESEWLERTVANPLNERFEAEANQHGWHIVEDHVQRFFGHAICTPAPGNWINTNLQALRKQGELDETDAIPGVDVSGGIAHPNRDGFGTMGTALRGVIRPHLIDHYTPDAAPVTTTTALATGFSATVSDTGLFSLTSGYWHRLRLRQLGNDGTVTNLPSAPDGLRELPYGTRNANYSRAGRYFVVARACGPLSRNGTLGCGPASPELPVSTVVPARPVDLSADGQAPAGVFFPSPGITIKWKHADQFSRHDTRVTKVRLVSGSTTIERLVPGPFTSTRVTGLRDGTTYSITVRACNDGNRCSAALGPVSETADQGESPASSISDLQRIDTALQGVPCSRSPVPFDPSLGPDSPGFEDPTPMFQPTCTEDPPVGRLRLARRVVRARAGRPAQVELRWRHPGNWQSLHEVGIQLIGARGVLATLRFDQDAERLTLSGGSRRGGKQLPVGRAGVLTARGVRVRVTKGAVRGSGLAGRDVRLRFAVTLPRSAGRRVAIAVGASDDAGQEQPPVVAGQIRLR